MKRLIFIISLFIALSCKENNPAITVYEIDPLLDRYLNTFYLEAGKRGVYLEKENLILKIIVDNTVEYCGLCTQKKGDNSIQRTVSINITPDCWNNEPEQNKEAIVFHELGHCLLGRSHKDDLFSDGSIVSLMHTKMDGPYQPCAYVFGGQEDVDRCNLTVRRPYYLDELFGLNPPQPFWVK